MKLTSHTVISDWRQRNPALCLDTKPITAVEIKVGDCRAVQNSGTRWEMLWEEVLLDLDIGKLLIAASASIISLLDIPDLALEPFPI